MKKDKLPKYMKIKSFVITQNLKNHIDILPSKTQENYCFIESMIIILSKKNPELFVNIHYKVWQNKMGPKYRYYITQMAIWNIIDINEPYLKDGDNSFCKSYKLSKESLLLPHIEIEFEKKFIHKNVDKSIVTDEVLEIIYDNLQKIGVVESLEKQPTIIDNIESKNWAPLVFDKSINLHYGKKVNRVYHTLIMMPKNSRKNLILIEDSKQQLYEYDIKSCHPVLILSLCDNDSEKEHYKSLLDNDIYTTIANSMGVFQPRDIIKDDFMYFINGEIHNYFYIYFHNNLPRLLNNILSKENMAIWAQNLEAKLMVKNAAYTLHSIHTLPHMPMQRNEVYDNQGLKVAKIPDLTIWIPMHDGWLGVEGDQNIISQKIRELFLQEIGYNITITRTNIKTGEKVII